MRRNRNFAEFGCAAGADRTSCGPSSCDDADDQHRPCPRVKKALPQPCQRIIYRFSLRPGKVVLALAVALAGILALSGRPVPLVDVLVGLISRSGVDGGVLSEELLRQLSEVKFDDLEKRREKKKKVAFLFLIRDSVPHQDLWRKWFESSTKGDWRDYANVYVHIKPSEESRPRTTIPDLDSLFCDRVIPSVRSKWFFLHHAMMQLLLYSYIQRDNAHFVFVSDTSVPLKSFDQVYDELVEKDRRSRICHADPGEGRGAWKPFSADPRVRGSVDVMDMSKSSLWSSYSRAHVRYLLEHAETLADWYGGYMDAPSHQLGAADEMLLPTMLRTHVAEEEMSDCHGSFDVGGASSQSQRRALAEGEGEKSTAGAAVAPSSALEALDSRRLCCPHAEKWGDGNTGEIKSMPRPGLYPLWDAHQCVGGPCEYEKLNTDELKEMTQMAGVLFLRKVPKNAQVFTKENTWIPLEEALGDMLAFKGGQEDQLPKMKHFCAVNH